MQTIVLLLLSFIAVLAAFVPTRVVTKVPSHGIYMALEDEGYGPMGSLVRQGPVPFFIRITKPDTYDAAVSKYMAIEKCNRLTAMANMDAYFMDPNGWAGRKLRVKKGELEDLDYANMGTNPSQLVLTGVWAIGILGLFYKIFQVQILGQQ